MELTPAIIIYSTEEVFSSSVLLDIAPGPPYRRTELPKENNITGVIYFSGNTTGYTAIHMSKETAEEITQDLLFEEDLEITEEVVQDTICELTNILAGRVKSYLDPPGSNLHISLPELRQGKEFSPETLPEAKKITVPFYLVDSEFWVEVQLSQCA